MADPSSRFISIFDFFFRFRVYVGFGIQGIEFRVSEALLPLTKTLNCGLYRDNIIYWGYYIPIMENHMEKKMENEMETWIIKYHD